MGFPDGSDGKASVCKGGDLGSIPGSGRFPEKDMATHSSTLAWKIPWTEEPHRLQSMGSQRVGHDWATSLHMSMESVMPSNHLILCHPLLLLPSIFPSIRVFSNNSVLRIRWPKCWSFSISPSSEYLGLISFRIDWLSHSNKLYNYLLYQLFSVEWSPTRLQSSALQPQEQICRAHRVPGELHVS